MTVAANAIVTLNEAKAFLIEKSTEFDSDIQNQINGLSTIFDRELGRKIKNQTLTDYRVDGTGYYRIILPWAPVQSVSKVDIRNDCDDSVYKTITDSSKWILKDKKQGLLQMVEDVLICGSRNILITMSVGYIDADVELAAIKDLFLKQLKFNYVRWRNQEIGVQSRTFQDGSIGFIPSGGMLKEVTENLQGFRDTRII